jgi:hypothetical protein
MHPLFSGCTNWLVSVLELSSAIAYHDRSKVHSLRLFLKRRLHGLLSPKYHRRAFFS